MAIGTPPVLEVSGGSTGASHAYGSFTPPANSRLYAWNTGRGASSTIPTISDDLGGTWNLIAGSDIDAGAVVASLYYQDIGGSPAAMVITIVSTSATQTGGGVVSVTGGQNDHTNLVSDTDTAGDPSLTMGAFGANSTGLGFYANTAGGAVVSPSGYTELLDAAVATNLRVSICFDSVSPGTAMAWTGTGTDTIGIGLEIKETSANKILAADAGSFALTGSAASLEYGREVVADAGSFVLTGSAASLEFGRELAADAGAFTLTGQAAALEYGRELVAEAGSFAFTGQDATLIYSAAGKLLVADAGSFTFTGQDATLTYAAEEEEVEVYVPRGRGLVKRRRGRKRLLPYEIEAFDAEEAEKKRKAKEASEPAKKVKAEGDIKGSLLSRKNGKVGKQVEYPELIPITIDVGLLEQEIQLRKEEEELMIVLALVA